MSWIPGWDSVSAATWWSSFYFWVGIAALLGLGISEVVSHRYSERKDELASKQQAAADRQHNEEIARLHLEAAQAAQRAAEADLARVQLEEKLAPRQLSLAQRNELIDSLKRFPGMVAHFWINPAGTSDTYWFGDLLYNLVQAAGWDAAKWILTTGIPSPVGGVTITWRDGSAINKEAAETFAETLRDAGIYAVAPNAFSKDDQTIGPQGQPAISVLTGRTTKAPTIRIFVATKPQ
jgi:hypothetical protein